MKYCNHASPTVEQEYWVVLFCWAGFTHHDGAVHCMVGYICWARGVLVGISTCSFRRTGFQIGVEPGCCGPPFLQGFPKSDDLLRPLFQRLMIWLNLYQNVVEVRTESSHTLQQLRRIAQASCLFGCVLRL